MQRHISGTGIGKASFHHVEVEVQGDDIEVSGADIVDIAVDRGADALELESVGQHR